MLDTIIISTAVTPIEANYFIHNQNQQNHINFTFTSTGAYTKDLVKFGILVVNVWFNKAKMIEEPLNERNCLINATIDATVLDYGSDRKHYEGRGTYKIETILDKLTSSCPFTSAKVFNFNRKEDLEWKIKDAYFTYNFVGKQKKTYYDLLNGGYDLSKRKLERITHRSKKVNEHTTVYLTEYAGKHKEDSERYQESVHIKIELNEHTYSEAELKKMTPERKAKIESEADTLLYFPYKKKDNRLHIQIQAKRNKIVKLCAEKGNPDRDVKVFLEQADTIDAELFKDYIQDITGEGKFYKYKDAEKIIRKSEHTRKEQDKMCDVLRGIASYKGITNYLNHIEDATLTYDCMASVRKKPYALKVMRNLQKLQICPLTLPVRSTVESPLDDLCTIYKKDYYKKES